MHKITVVLLSTLLFLSACSTDDSSDQLDAKLRSAIAAQNLTGDASSGRELPSISDPVAQLGMKLFFSKSLGGELDSACVTCHHPNLGGGDNMALSFGVGAIQPDVLGPGRGDPTAIPNVPRNAPTTFNIGLWDSSLFWDSRVVSQGAEKGQNGAASAINTPDSGFGVLDVNAGANLVVAQARFPVTSHEEMRGSFEEGNSNDALRAHLQARIGNYGIGAGELGDSNWLDEFQMAFASSASAEDLITFDNIVIALAAYERSQVFVDSPWKAYVQGDEDALSDDAKRGALLFLTSVEEQGGGCVTCHSGDLFTDEKHHAIASPQIGPGKGNPNNNDFGRANVNGLEQDRFRFRTPTLLNVAVTGPYMHAGAYETLEQVLDHYADPEKTVSDFFANKAWCESKQFAFVENCDELYPTGEQNTQMALTKVRQERADNDPDALPSIDLNAEDRRMIIAFLESLTDSCVTDPECMAQWIADPDTAPDQHQLNAIDVDGNTL